MCRYTSQSRCAITLEALRERYERTAAAGDRRYWLSYNGHIGWSLCCFYQRRFSNDRVNGWHTNQLIKRASRLPIRSYTMNHSSIFRSGETRSDLQVQHRYNASTAAIDPLNRGRRFLFSCFGATISPCFSFPHHFSACHPKLNQILITFLGGRNA